MSYFSVLDFLESGKRSLSDKNYYSALSVALALPSMCSRVEYKDNSDYCYRDKNGKLRWHDKKSYVDFCNDQFRTDMWLHECFGKDVGDVLYNLRCDIVHAGCADVYDGDYAIWLSYGQSIAGLSTFSKYKIVSIESICRSVFNHIETWVSWSGVVNYQYTLVFGDDRDDRLLYDRLCDSERASYLEEQFV